MSNTFGTLFTLTTFGESHGEALGGIIDGVPAGFSLDLAAVQREVDRRRPTGQSGSTTRREADQVHFLSGLFEGKTTGAPIGFVVRNTDARPEDYDACRHLFRPSHADYAWFCKYGIRDHRGGGRTSARTTVCRVVAGVVARQLLQPLGVSIAAHVSQIGTVSNPTAEAMEQLLAQVKGEGDTVGGIVTCIVRGCPPGWGEPEAGKLHAMLAAAMLSIPAAKGFDIGDGFDAARQRGSQRNDQLTAKDGQIAFRSNHDGGIQGGISNGQDIVFRVAFKPIPTLAQPQSTVDDEGNSVVMQPRGRHDVCAAPRAVPIVEAMTAMILLDACLQHRARTL